MADIKIVRNEKGLTGLRKSDGVNDLIKSIADDIAARCGDGYEADLYTAGRTRNNASVGPRTPEAVRDNYRNNTLLKCMKGG